MRGEEMSQAMVHLRALELEKQQKNKKKIVACEGDVSLIVHGIEQNNRLMTVLR